MDDKELLNQYSWETTVGVSFGGLFSALTLFFVGLIISNYNSYESYVRIPVLFLIISTFGFIYATLIYANATGKLNLHNLKNCGKGINTADVLSEFIGLYSLLIAVPLVIPIVTNDTFLITSVFIADVVGMIIYHASGFSIIQEYYPKLYMLIIGVVVALMFSILVILKSGFQMPLLILVSITIIMLITLALLAIKKISIVK